MIITNAKIVTPDKIIEGSVVVEDGEITEIVEGGMQCTNKDIIDAQGKYLLPGFVDIHGDDLEMEINPRPLVRFPIDFALINLDRETTGCGITTKLHAIAYFEDELKERYSDRSKEIIETINKLKSRLRVNHYVHARCEISSDLSNVLDVIDDSSVKLVSIMDHTPGQGQFKKFEDYKIYHKRVYGLKEGEIEELVKKKRESDKMHNLRKIINKSHRNKIPIASHDDDIAEKVDMVHQMGAQISEFPVTLESAKRAKELDMMVSMGAPNVVRGKSSTGNLSAIAAIQEGLVDVLCSDYNPASMLYAPFVLAKKGLLEVTDAVNMVSLNPAKAIGMNTVGSIEEGKRADMLIIDEIYGIPFVLKTIVNGWVVYDVEPR
jgi:alpha-D-ribose 1-methylphosphonate 5-triphosphate diphosphatase